MAQTRTFNTMMAILFKHFITFKCKYVRKDTQFPYNIFTKHRFIPSQIYIYPLTDLFKILFYNTLVINILPPPPRKIFISTFITIFFCEGSHFGCEGLNFAQNDCNFVAENRNEVYSSRK